MIPYLYVPSEMYCASPTCCSQKFDESPHLLQQKYKEMRHKIAKTIDYKKDVVAIPTTHQMQSKNQPDSQMSTSIHAKP
jgi:hypothetical protein